MTQFCSLDLRDFVEKKANYHTHTTRCKHAEGEEREYVEKAIEAGYHILGFSDHAPYVWGYDHVSPIRMEMHELEGYVRTIEKLKEEYKKDITIYTGLEIEYFPGQFETTIEKIKQFSLDYMLLGQHYLTTEMRERYVGRRWEDDVAVQTYIEHLKDALSTGYFLYVAHPDIIHYIGDEMIRDEYFSQIAGLLKKYDMPIEVNVNGYRAGIQYPNPRFVEIGVANGNDFIIGVDAHKPNELLDYKNFDGCVELVKSRGGKIINL